MKTTPAFFLGVFLAVSAWAQGTIDFANTSTTLLTTNSTSTPPFGQPNQTGPTTGAGQYTIGLYIAPQGTTDPTAFTLMGPTTVNQSGGPAGRFNGRFNGNPGASNFVISNNTGQAIAFQVRAWSTFAGATFEEMRLNFITGTYVGISSIGEVTPATGLQLPPSLFAGPGQISGFVLYPRLPEPSTKMLMVVGAVLGLGISRFSSRRKR